MTTEEQDLQEGRLTKKQFDHVSELIENSINAEVTDLLSVRSENEFLHMAVKRLEATARCAHTIIQRLEAEVNKLRTSNERLMTICDDLAEDS